MDNLNWGKFSIKIYYRVQLNPEVSCYIAYVFLVFYRGNILEGSENHCVFFALKDRKIQAECSLHFPRICKMNHIPTI